MNLYEYITICVQHILFTMVKMIKEKGGLYELFKT